MDKSCCNSNNDQYMILCCSGGSNVGQLANATAIRLTEQGVGKMFCLVGVGGDLPKFVESVKNKENVLLIDGCEVGCGFATLKRHNIEPKKISRGDEIGYKKRLQTLI